MALLPLEAQGLWLRLVCIMRGAPKKGFLVDKEGKPLAENQLRILTGTGENQLRNLLRILVDKGGFSVNKAGAIFCRRIVKESELSIERSHIGRKGGVGKSLAKPVANDMANSWQNDQQNAGKSVASGSGSTSVDAKNGQDFDLTAHGLAQAFIFHGGRLRMGENLDDAVKDFEDLIRIGHSPRRLLDLVLDHGNKRQKREFLFKFTDRLQDKNGNIIKAQDQYDPERDRRELEDLKRRNAEINKEPSNGPK